MSKKRYYGVLMNRINIYEDIYLFQPNYIISGTLEESDNKKVFVDDMNQRYCLSDDADFLRCDDMPLSVSSLISEEELAQSYPNVPLAEAKSFYFNTLKDYIHVGFYLLPEDKIVLCSYNASELFTKISSRSEDMEEYDLEESKISYNQKNSCPDTTDFVVEELIPILATDFKKMLDIYDDKKLREKLRDLYRQYEDGNVPVSLDLDAEEYPSLEDDLTKEKILEFFNVLFERILASNQLREILDIGTIIEQSLTKLILMLDARGNNEIPINAAEEILYRLIDDISIIMSTEDLAQIKKDIFQMKIAEVGNINQVAIIYEEYDRKLKGQMHDEFLPNSSEKEQLSISAKEMKTFFDKRIAGQEDAKKTIISAVVMNSLSENARERISCFLVGPTGSGKTLIAETLGEYLDVPYVIVDSTQLTSAGYVGRDIEDFLARLITKAGGDVKRAEEGIVVFDELDKKGSDKKSDISGKAVLIALLPFFQGTDYEVRNGKDKVIFNTSKLTIFATGACIDIAKAKLQKEGLGLYKKTSIGFGAAVSSIKAEEDFKYPELEPEDFSKYGGIPEELIGRITTICQLSGHTVETLKFILTDMETSTLLSLQRNLLKIGIALSWTEDYLEAVAQKAIKLKTGARSLKTTVEQSVKEARWEVLMAPDKSSGILLTSESVEDPFACKLIDKEGKSFTVREIYEQTKESDTKVKKIGTMV